MGVLFPPLSCVTSLAFQDLSPLSLFRSVFLTIPVIMVASQLIRTVPGIMVACLPVWFLEMAAPPLWGAAILFTVAFVSLDVHVPC